MTVAASPGYPQYSGILIPEIWSGKLLAKFYAATVLAAIANTDYEGEIKKQGDTVHIRTTPDIVINDYVKGQRLDIQHPEPNVVDLQINRAKYWNAVIDDIDKFQADINAQEDWSRDASEQMKIKWDRDALGSIYVDAHADNQGATAGADSHSVNLGTTAAQLTVGNASGNVGPVDFLIRLGQVMDEQNVPEEGRFAVIPTWLAAKLKLSDLKNAYLTGDKMSPVRNGRIGDVDRLTLYISNLLPGGTATTAYKYVIAGQRSALTYASQLTNTETLKSESTFGTLFRGLHVCDWEVIKPEALVTAVVTPGG